MEPEHDGPLASEPTAPLALTPGTPADRLAASDGCLAPEGRQPSSVSPRAVAVGRHVTDARATQG